MILVTVNGYSVEGQGVAEVNASVLFSSSLAVPSAILSVLSSTSPVFKFGTVEVEAAAYALETGMAAGSGTGTLVVPFTVVRTGSPPFLPTQIPVYLDVTGLAQSLYGTGTATMSASIPGLTFSVPAVLPSSIAVFAAPTIAAFTGPGQTAPYSAGGDLDVNPYGATYTLTLTASASVLAEGSVYASTVYPPEDDLTVYMDPIMAFDQTSFDALYGSAAYQLSDYYSIVPATNLPAPVPEPATMLLLGSGLIGLAGLWRKFKK